MTKREFLSELEKFLSYELPERLVKENLEFYENYIRDEVRGGKSEAAVIGDLGDPQVIARTCIDALKSGSDGIPGSEDDVDFNDEMYNGPTKEEREEAEKEEKRAERKVKLMGCGTLILIVLIVLGIFSIIGAVLSFLSPVIAVVLVGMLIAYLVLRIFGKRL
ncbi:MAG: DUF1700 domain-containing protein [Eubacteriales bacterium]|nr:DUF1700 domain-containing protein [Eubacteriales bacterium]